MGAGVGSAIWIFCTSDAADGEDPIAMLIRTIVRACLFITRLRRPFLSSQTSCPRFGIMQFVCQFRESTEIAGIYQAMIFRQADDCKIIRQESTNIIG